MTDQPSGAAGDRGPACASGFLLAGLCAMLLMAEACESVGDPVPNDGSPPGMDVDQPYPIDLGDAGAQTPGKYKGLWLRLVDNGQPSLEPVDSLFVVVCIGMLESAGGCGDFVARITSHWIYDRARNVFVANCGRAGFGIESWADARYDHLLWEPCLLLLRAWFSLTPSHVAAMYYHVAGEAPALADQAGPPVYPDPESGYFRLQASLTTLSRRLKTFFPSLQAVYLSSRTYGGFADPGVPAPREPASYEEGHAVNSWLRDNPTVNGVWFGWGAYQWAPDCASGIANGQEICYSRDDYGQAGVAPSARGRGKMSWQMHHRLRLEAWYRGGS